MGFEDQETKVDCCSMMLKKAEIFKALSNPIRLCLLKTLIEEGPKNVTYLTEKLQTSQSNVSQNLGRLRALGIIDAKKQGNQVIYGCYSEEIINIYNATRGRMEIHPRKIDDDLDSGKKQE